MIAKWRSLDAFGKFLILVSVFLVLQFSYSTIAWLLSSHPFGALVPGVFLYFFACNLYGRLRYANTYEAAIRSLGFIVVTGTASAISIVILWTLAEKRDDEVYHDQAVTMSFWGGAAVIVTVLILLFLATPKGRQRLRDQRQAVTGNAKDAPGAPH